MKLPREINSSVPQLRAQPSTVENELRVIDATKRVLGTAGEAVNALKDARDAARLSSTLAQSLTDYEKMSAYLKEKQAIDILNDPFVPIELRDEITNKLNLKMGDITDANGQAFIPAFEVRGMIHDYQLNQLMKKGKSFLGGDRNLISKYSQMVAEKTRTTIGDITALNVKQEASALDSRMDFLYTQAVKTGNEQNALEIISSASVTGIWSPEKVSQKLQTVQGDIRYSQLMTQVTSGNAIDIQAAQVATGNDVTMTPQQKWEIYSKAESVLIAKEADQKEKNKLISNEVLNNNLILMGENKVLPWSYIKQVKGSMTPDDAQTLINANRAAANGGATTSDNPTLVNQLSVMIGRLSVPDSSTPHNVRKATVINALHEAMGYNPVTDKYTGNAQLKRESYFALLNEVNKSEERILNDPRLEMVIDTAYRQLTGGSRDIVNLAGKVSANYLSAVEYERDIRNAALSFGPGFDADQWHAKHWKKYASQTLSNNYNRMLFNRLSNFAVTTDGIKLKLNLNNINAAQSTETIKQAVKDGTLDDDDAIELINYIDSGNVATQDSED